MLEQGEVVLISVPFSDLSSSKRRPVLIISSDNYNAYTDDIIVMAITSSLSSKLSCIDIDNDNLVSGKLVTKSQIRTDKVYTLSQNIVIKQLCKVTPQIVDISKAKLFDILDN